MNIDQKLAFRMAWINRFGWSALIVAAAGVVGWFLDKNPNELFAVAGALSAAATGLFWSHTSTTPSA